MMIEPSSRKASKAIALGAVVLQILLARKKKEFAPFSTA
jgi:hypothetical protein